MNIPQDVVEAIVDPKAYADGERVDQAFAWLRREAPLEMVQAEGYDPFWAVTRHADILEVERQNDLFRSGEGPVNLMAAETRSSYTAPPVRTLVQMDGAEHKEFRRLSQAWFMPKNLRNLDARIRQIAAEIVDKMAAMGGECDFARDIALYYPLRVIMEILGVPQVDEPLMLTLTQELFGSNDPELKRGGAEDANIQRHSAVADFAAYFAAITESRRQKPLDDLASVIANGIIAGKPIGPAEAIGYYIITATAGHDTTSSTTATGMWVLAERPELFRALKADPRLIAGHVEESIRWASAVKHFMRTASADAELGGRKIAKGDWLMLSYPSGNRDEAVFDDPFTYDITRSPNRHLAFGYGAHLCIGQHLARLEMRILWETLLERLESVELAGTPTRTAANFVSGPKSVPIRYRMS